MYGDEKIRVESYCDKLKAQMCQFYTLSFQCMTQNEAMMLVHGGVPRKACIEGKDVGNVSIFSCNKKIFCSQRKEIVKSQNMVK